MDIAAWLTGLGLERYLQTFAENDVDGALLHQLTDGDLKDIGIASLGHRKKLLEAIAGLTSAPDVTRVPSIPRPAGAGKQIGRAHV